MPDLLEIGDERTWQYRGQLCKIRKNCVGHWCGYTATSLRGFSYRVLYDYGGDDGVHLVDIHGGLTYGPDDEGWVGFDCGHAYDLCLDERGEPWGEMTETLGKKPLEIRRRGSVEACEEADQCTVWRLADVKRETERLADQFIALEAFVSSLE